MTPDAPINATPASSTQKPASKRKKARSQERLMIMFTLYFIIGILLLVLIPEGHPARALAMALYSIALYWSMYRFCV